MIVAVLSHDQMIDILRKPGSVSAVTVPPFQSGKPRKYVLFISLFCLIYVAVSTKKRLRTFYKSV